MKCKWSSKWSDQSKYHNVSIYSKAIPSNLLKPAQQLTSWYLFGLSETHLLSNWNFILYLKRNTDNNLFTDKQAHFNSGCEKLKKKVNLSHQGWRQKQLFSGPNFRRYFLKIRTILLFLFAVPVDEICLHSKLKCFIQNSKKYISFGFATKKQRQQNASLISVVCASFKNFTKVQRLYNWHILSTSYIYYWY